MRITRSKINARRAAVVAALLCALAAPAFARAQGGGRAGQLEQAAALIGGGRLAEAERQLEQVLKAAPEEPAALNLLGTIRAQQGRLEEAESLFARAVRNDARLTGARMNLAHLYLLKGEAGKTAAELGEVLRIEPANAEAGYRLAWLLLSQGRFDDCVALVEKLKQTQTPTGLLLAVLGDAYMAKGDAGRAEENYLLALKAGGANADALIGLAQVSRSRGDAQAAADQLGRARAAADASPDALGKLARVALGADLKAEAVSALRRAAELRPGEPSHHFALGAAWLRNPPDLVGAEQSFRQFLRLRPEDARGQLLLGYVLLKQKKHDEARAWLERNAARADAAPEAFYYLGLIAQGQNEDARAVELFERAARAAPAFAPAHVALGSVLLKLKDYERARQSLETGVRLSPEDTKAHYNLAVLYARLKDTERAQAAMRVVERLKREGKAQADDGDPVAPPPPR